MKCGCSQFRPSGTIRENCRCGHELIEHDVDGGCLHGWTAADLGFPDGLPAASNGQG